MTTQPCPLIISSMGIVVFLITTLFATDLFEINTVSQIELSLKQQLLISTILMTAGIAIVSFFALPSEFTLYNFGSNKVVKNWHLFFCVAIGLWAALVIGYITGYYPSSAYSPVQDVADSCRTGAATNVIFGLGLGYKSVIIPIFAIPVAIYVSFSLAAMYGIAVAALGMLSTVATALAIDAYGPITDNARGIAEMAGMRHEIRERTDALDAAGNTAAAIGKVTCYLRYRISVAIQKELKEKLWISNYQLPVPYGTNYWTIKPVKYLILKSYTGLTGN